MHMRCDSGSGVLDVAERNVGESRHQRQVYEVEMSPQLSAGVMLYRRTSHGIEVLIAHPGGPFWAHRDEGAWTIPKGLVPEGESARAAAAREFFEETGCRVESEHLWELGEVTLRSGKRIVAFAAEGTCEPDEHISNDFTMEWPRGSGVERSFPEIDRIEWATPEVAAQKLNAAQVALVVRLTTTVSSS